MVLNRMLAIVAAALIFLTGSATAHSPPESAVVFFVNLKDGATVTSPLKVAFGIKDFGVTTAGDNAKRKHVAGHHHLLIDLEQLPQMDEPLPYSNNIVHYDQGETDTTLELPPGQHTLQLLLADEDHEPHEPPLLSKKITITVK